RASRVAAPGLDWLVLAGRAARPIASGFGAQDARRRRLPAGVGGCQSRRGGGHLRGLGGRRLSLLFGPLPGGRHFGESGSGLDGRLTRAARPFPRHPPGGIRGAASFSAEAWPLAHQSGAQARGPRADSGRDSAAAKEGLWDSGGALDPRTAAKPVRGSLQPAVAARVRGVSSGACPKAVATPPAGGGGSAKAALDDGRVPALATALGALQRFSSPGQRGLARTTWAHRVAGRPRSPRGERPARSVR